MSDFVPARTPYPIASLKRLRTYDSEILAEKAAF